MALIAMIDDEPDFSPLNSLANDVLALSQRAKEEYEPIVERLIDDGCRDAGAIEQTLDGLLGFCAYKPVLTLYRRLCRHYYGIDPNAAAAYVYAYRELWVSPDIDSE
jgi:hypothetical protein